MQQPPLFAHAALPDASPGSARAAAHAQLERDPDRLRQLRALNLTFGEARVYRTPRGLLGAGDLRTPDAAARTALNLQGLTRLLTLRGLRGLRKAHDAHLTALPFITWHHELQDLAGQALLLDGDGRILGRVTPEVSAAPDCPHCGGVTLHVHAGTVHGGTWHPDGPVTAPVIDVQRLRCGQCQRTFPPVALLDGDDGGLTAALRSAPHHPSPLETP